MKSSESTPARDPNAPPKLHQVLSVLPAKQRVEKYLELAKQARRDAPGKPNAEAYWAIAEQWELLARETQTMAGLV